ncbi:MAG: hypothetical protein A2096_05130 [Spirochaetes bacterium GWF1_41_5]|nr:MAG: hypothetical protein A2096_05130 [Spirochaetes bacterium GWF1_41_5]
MVALVLFSAISLPLYAVFAKDIPVLLIIIVFLFFCDIFINLRVAVKTKNGFCWETAEILKSYRKGFFIPDMIAALPWWLPVALLFKNEEPGIITRFLFLLPLIKILKIGHYLQVFEKSLTINPTIIRLIKFIVLVGIIAHWLASGWVLIGPVKEGLPADDFSKYIRALYWCITTIATVGYGDISPDLSQNHQIIYTMFSMILGVGIYGYVIGNVASLLANIDVAKANFMRRMEEINSFIKNKKIPLEIAQKILDYYNYLWETQQGGNDSQVMNELPQSLSIEVSMYLNKTIIQKVPFFTKMNEVFIREIIMQLEPLIFLPQDYIVRRGEFGDCMFFLSAGSVDVKGSNGELYATLGEGAFFGEMSLIRGEKRNAYIMAREYCDVYRLTKESFDELRRKYPDFDQQVIETVAERDAMNKKKTEKPAAPVKKQ